MVTRTPNISLAKPEFDRRQWQDLMNDNMTVIDALWAKYFATTGLVGVWQNATAYSANELVVDEDAGTIWRCAVAHTSASSGTFLAARVASPTYWSNYTIGVRYKGAWASAATYAVGDFVVASNSFFAVANKAHTAASAFALDQTAGKWEVLIDTSAAMSTINAAVSSAQTSATQAALSVIAAGTYATAAGTYATAAGTYATAAALSAAMAAAGVVWCGTGSGADDIVLTAASFTLVDGATVEWRQVSDNTTTVRLNPNGVGLTALLDANGTAISTAGTLKANRIYRAKYSTTTAKFEFLGPASAAAASQAVGNAATSADTFLSPAVAAAASWMQVRNYADNPEGVIFQRATPTTDNAYAWDRWRLLLGAANAATVSSLTTGLPTGAKSCMRLTVGSGNNNKFGIFQVLEGVNMYALRSQTVCLQAQIKATAGLTDIRMAIVEWTGTENATTGDPISAWNTMATVPTYNAGWANLNTPTNLAVTTNFAQYSVTATLGATGKNLGIFIWSEDTSNTQTTDILDVTMIQLSIAGGPTKYAPRAYADELLKCLRYCNVFTNNGDGGDQAVAIGYAISTTVFRCATLFQVPMRTTPSVSFSAVTDFYVSHAAGGPACTDLVDDGTYALGLGLRATVASGLTAGQGGALRYVSAPQRITCSAEL